MVATFQGSSETLKLWTVETCLPDCHSVPAPRGTEELNTNNELLASSFQPKPNQKFWSS